MREVAHLRLTILIVMASIAYGAWAAVDPVIAEPVGIAYIVCVMTTGLLWLGGKR